MKSVLKGVRDFIPDKRFMSPCVKQGLINFARVGTAVHCLLRPFPKFYSHVCCLERRLHKKLTGITEQTGILAIKNSEGCFDEVLTAVQKIADKNEKIEVNTIEQTIKNIQHRYSASINALYMTSAILFVFGSISLMNMLMVDFQNRKREFGLLEAVGVTRKQLKAMLNREIGIYLGGSLAISLICGSIFSVIVCRRLDAINHCITLKLPWFFLLALICVLLVIYLVFSMYSKMELKKASILSAIKSE